MTETFSFSNVYNIIRRGKNQKPLWLKLVILGFPGGAVVKNLPANAGDVGSSPGLGRYHMSRSN